MRKALCLYTTTIEIKSKTTHACVSATKTGVSIRYRYYADEA